MAILNMEYSITQDMKSRDWDYEYTVQKSKGNIVKATTMEFDERSEVTL